MFNCTTYLQRDISSAEDLAAVRTAIELCHSNELKKEVLCDSGSEYDRYKNRHYSFPYCKEKWKEILENKTTTILENLGLPRVLLEKVTGLVILIGMRMLKWAKYHDIMLGLSREYSIKFLNSTFFTPQGIMDNKKAAEELMKNGSLSIKQKYMLACLYCFMGYIPYLFREMSQEEKENIGQSVNYPKIVKFWSDYLMGEIDKSRGGKTVIQYMLEKAVESGSKAAVQYCLEETSLSRKKDAAVDAALDSARSIAQVYDNCFFLPDNLYGMVDSHVEGIPIDDSADILCFLLSKTNEEQKIEFLKRDCRFISDVQSRPTVLFYFLDWPYQNYFLKTANLMWDFLPERTYVELLHKICDKIRPANNKLKNGEEKSCDYRKLLKEFWSQSPDRYKRSVLSDNEALSSGERLLIFNLFSFKNDSYEKRKIFELISDITIQKERERIVASEEAKGRILLDKYLPKFISSKQKANEFKRRLDFKENARAVCADFIKCIWDATEYFMKWTFLNQEEIIRFKREIICSEHGRYACWDLFFNKGGHIADRFCEGCFSSEEESRKFKKELTFSVGVESCADLVVGDKLEAVDEFINWSQLSQDEIREFKKHLQREKGNYICGHLVAGSIQFKEAETFFAWLELSPEEVKELKKESLFNHQETFSLFRTIVFKVKDNERRELIEFLLRWYLTDKETVLEFRSRFKRKYEDQEMSEEDWTALGDFDSATEQRFNDLDEAQRGTKRKSQPSKNLCNVGRKARKTAKYCKITN